MISIGKFNKNESKGFKVDCIMEISVCAEYKIHSVVLFQFFIRQILKNYENYIWGKT